MKPIFQDRFKALCVACLLAAGMVFFLPHRAQAQEHYVSNADPEPSGDSARTGTQGVNGNPFCASPVITINGAPTTVRNWSCYNGPDPRVSTIGRQPPQFSGAPDPCRPGGPGGYNYLNNAVGTQLPKGCGRPEGNGGNRRIHAKSDPNYEPRPMSTDRVSPMRIGPMDLPQAYRRPAMPVGQLAPGKADPYFEPRPMRTYRRPPMPVGQVATGGVDPYFEPRPMSNYRRPPMPIGQIASGEVDPYFEPRPISTYRRPPMPVGKLSPGYGGYQSGTGRPTLSYEWYRRPALPIGQISPGY